MIEDNDPWTAASIVVFWFIYSLTAAIVVVAIIQLTVVLWWHTQS